MYNKFMNDKKRTIFISYEYSYEGRQLRKIIEKSLENSGIMINYSENEDKSANSNSTIWNWLHNRISGSSVTVLAYTSNVFNKLEPSYSFETSPYIYREINATLRNWKDNKINGLVVVFEEEHMKHFLPAILKENEEFIVFVTKEGFIRNPKYYINKAFENRQEQINHNKYNIKYKFHN